MINIKFIITILFFTISLFGNESEILPVNVKGRFRPLFIENQPLTNLDLKMIPSKRHPDQWLPLKTLKENKTNLSLFTQSEWLDLQASLDDDELFTKTYLKAYHAIAGKSFSLSQSTTLSFPTIGQLKAEVFYYKWPLINYVILCYLFAVLFFVLKEGFQSRILSTLAWIFFGIAFIFHSIILALRIYILMRPPVSSMAETIIYVPWIGVILSAWLTFKLKSFFPALSGSILAVSLLSILQWTFTSNPLDQVQAVLNSQFWLTVHVLMIVGSYGALILAGILGHFYLIGTLFGRYLEPLKEAILLTLYIGVALLIPGTLLGGVWAAQSWGRFWDWDPKESWAFISACVYLLVIHSYRFKKIGAVGIAIGAIAGMVAISFTWYGVNYILGTGLHSYGFGSGGEWFYYSYCIFEMMFVGYLALRKLTFDL